MTLFQLLLLTASLISSRCLIKENTKLLLVQALFRHGDRAPTFLYPTDPNCEENWPLGLAELTEIGRKQHYAVGKFLRYLYKDFVTSNPREVYVNSSAINRCLSSAAANLASFYAPEEKWKFEEDLEWQPIPIHYLPPNMDKKYYNLIIPEWANYYWNEIQYIAMLVFKAFYSSPIQLRLRAGPFLETVAENLKNKIDKNSPHLKVVVSSTHDVNVAAVLLALNFTNMERPPYCATLLFELHEMADYSMAVRLLYMNSTDPLAYMGEPRVLFLDGCSEFCPVEHFIESFQWLIPGNWEKECQLDVPDIDEDR
ncbi:testicular acid phosphatase homolog [Argiope bruennichi]|uniref:testicular acid phosphatase homolog n=1 Tax=Argiope bruennichi TaxID=94029 RepID=UPI00249402C7|nr:testicular acid phosphatase homolog [Argiope bruennichi]